MDVVYGEFHISKYRDLLKKRKPARVLIRGDLAEEDLVFVLDVNRDYEPWLIARERMFAAMDTLDGEQKRGLLLVGP